MHNPSLFARTTATGFSKSRLKGEKLSLTEEFGRSETRGFARRARIEIDFEMRSRGARDAKVSTGITSGQAKRVLFFLQHFVLFLSSFSFSATIFVCLFFFFGTSCVLCIMQVEFRTSSSDVFAPTREDFVLRASSCSNTSSDSFVVH